MAKKGLLSTIIIIILLPRHDCIRCAGRGDLSDSTNITNTRLHAGDSDLIKIMWMWLTALAHKWSRV